MHGVQLDALHVLGLNINWMERSLEAQDPKQVVQNQDVLQVLRLYCILARSCASSFIIKSPLQFCLCTFDVC